MQENFKIFKVTPEEAKKIASEPNEPHVHDFEELLVGEYGMVEHFIDFRAVAFKAPFISFVTKGKVHRIRPMTDNGKCSIWGIRFKSDFIPELIFRLYLYYHGHANIEMKNDESFQRLLSICEMMYGEMQRKEPSLVIVRELLKTLLTIIEIDGEKYSPRNQKFEKVQNTTFVNFLKILEENFRRAEGVEFYAEKLFMSSRNLNLICRKIINESVSDIIETRKLMEAKNLLIYSDKSVSEISFELGYNEKAHFSSVFKKKNGLTPSEFREEMRKIIS